jgi:hypothetical protein
MRRNKSLATGSVATASSATLQTGPESSALARLVDRRSKHRIRARGALFFILRKALGSPRVCIVGGAWTETQSESAGSWLNLTASMPDTIDDGVGASTGGCDSGTPEKLLLNKIMMRPPLSTMFARPIPPGAVAVLKAVGPQSAGPKLGSLRILTLVSNHKESGSRSPISQRH